MRPKAAGKRLKLPRGDWRRVTPGDLEDWADQGSLARGAAYFENGNVRSLAFTSAGELLAWVQGNEQYAVRVAVAPRGESPRFMSLCSCPIGYGCKHAVAAILAYFDAAARGDEIPLAAADDPRRQLAGNIAASNQEPGPRDLRELLAAKTHDELVNLVISLSQQLVSVRDGLDECARLIIDPEPKELGVPRESGSQKYSPRVFHG